MRSARDFFKPLAVGAPEPLREIPFKPSRVVHFFPPQLEKVRAKLPDIVGKVDILLGNLEDAIPMADKEAARAGLVEVGWDWADAARGVEVVGFDRTTMATTVRSSALLQDGSVRAVQSVVVPDRQIPTPTCGVIDGPEYTTDTVWRVERSDEVEPTLPART